MTNSQQHKFAPRENLGTPLRFTYFGTPLFSTFVLDELAAAGFTPSLVVTNPDKPAGRGLDLRQPPVKQWALAHNIPVLQPEMFNDEAITKLKSAGCDTAVVAAYGKILPKAVLDLFPNRAFNVHPSLLPRYRGTSPVESQILADEKHVGVSVILMDELMDHGPLVAQEELSLPGWPIARDTLNERLWHAGGKLLAKVFAYENAAVKPQDHTMATVTKKIRKEDGELDLAAPGRENYLKYLAYEGWPGTYFFKDGVRHKITKASFKNGYFKVERVIPEGKREQDYQP
jgi:methionyl-tRNA formyltransferase